MRRRRRRLFGCNAECSKDERSRGRKAEGRKAEAHLQRAVNKGCHDAAAGNNTSLLLRRSPCVRVQNSTSSNNCRHGVRANCFPQEAV